MKLGGWWRLWIVSSGIYAAILAVAFASHWPKASEVPHGPWLLYRMSQSSQRLLQRPSPTMQDLEQGLAEADRSGNVIQARELAKQITVGREQPWRLYPIAIPGPNGHYLSIPADSTKEEAADIAGDYKRVVEDEAFRQKVKRAELFLLALICPPTLLLALVFSALWVRRGFQNNRTAAS
jgi:hypothetical protein